MDTFKNPIIPGFYPDPSICRVNQDYYLVTSTFEYFPGVPIFHSVDLVNWTQVGHVLDRPSQLNLDGTPNSRGIYAPTIRHHNGLFYVITTFVESQYGERRNFYVTAENPAGPWSEPVWLKGAPGIDPSLFFDDDNRVYYTGNRVPPTGQTHAKHMEIWLQELDVNKGTLIGDPVGIWDGALKIAHAQEAPHIYKKDGFYYLVIAEGGTGFTHAVTVARSKTIAGPYEANPRNPILTHRHLGKDTPITNVGHGDLVDTEDGDWWMVCLGSRPYGGMFRNLGRETFLAPVRFEDDWPVVCPDTGRIEEEMRGPKLPRQKVISSLIRDEFDQLELGMEWNMIRTPRERFYTLAENPGFLRLKLRPETLADCASPSFIGRRQQHLSYNVSTKLLFSPETQGEAAGLTLFHSQTHHYRFEVISVQKQPVVRVVKREGTSDEVVGELSISETSIELKVEAQFQELTFLYRNQFGKWHVVAKKQDGRVLSTDRAGGFVGTYIGLFATSNGNENTTYADFDWFDYKGE